MILAHTPFGQVERDARSDTFPSGNRPISGLSPPPLFDWGADP